MVELDLLMGDEVTLLCGGRLVQNFGEGLMVKLDLVQSTGYYNNLICLVLW